MKKILAIALFSASSASLADQVISDNLIIDGSQCVGIDCASGHNFGFDTFVIKENNVRMFFDDTSNSANFPSVDWRFTFNDSDNGGSNYFSVDNATNGKTPFKIMSGAGDNALIVNAQGNVGIGTSTPVLELQVTDGDTPGLRLEQNTSNGWNAQIWDISGNETNFFIRDVSNNSKLPLRIYPGTGDNNLVLRNGNVGINTNSPQYPVHFRAKNTHENTTPILYLETTQSETQDQSMIKMVNANGDSRIEMTNSSTGVTWRITDDSGNLSITKVGSGAKEFEILADGTLVVTGDIKFKYNNTDVTLSNLLQRIEALEN